MKDVETKNVEVRPRPAFLGQQHGRFAFSYEITITNRSKDVVQLLNRHWVITHGDGHIEEVYGEGVVGKQPRLKPGETFVYTSGALIPTRNGSMAGSYEFTTDSGRLFKVAIPEFVLAAPESLH